RLAVDDRDALIVLHAGKIPTGLRIDGHAHGGTDFHARDELVRIEIEEVGGFVFFVTREEPVRGRVDGQEIEFAGRSGDGDRGAGLQHRLRHGDSNGTDG